MERGIKSRALQIRKHMVAVAGWHQSLKYKSSNGIKPHGTSQE